MPGKDPGALAGSPVQASADTWDFHPAGIGKAIQDDYIQNPNLPLF